MTTLLFGCSGQLGRAITDVTSRFVNISAELCCVSVDVTVKDLICSACSLRSGDIVINASAFTNVDLCDNPLLSKIGSGKITRASP